MKKNKNEKEEEYISENYYDDEESGVVTLHFSEIDWMHFWLPSYNNREGMWIVIKEGKLYKKDEASRLIAEHNANRRLEGATENGE